MLRSNKAISGSSYHSLAAMSYYYTRLFTVRSGQLLVGRRRELLSQELQEVERQAGHGRDQQRLPGEHPRQDEGLVCNGKSNGNCGFAVLPG